AMQNHRIRIHRFPLPAVPHLAYVKDRRRNSGLTSLRFVGGERFVCCDFNDKRMYMAEMAGAQVRIVAAIPTVIQDGTPVQTDLLDFNGDDLLVTSNFYQGSQSLYALRGDTLTFVEELKPNDFIRCHGVRFVPGYRDLLWVTYCGNENKCIAILDFRNRRVLHLLPMPEQMQDTAFLGEYALAPARTDHIRVKAPYGGAMYATVYLFRMPADLYRDPPQLIDTWRGEGHLDAMKEYGGEAYSANQYTDCVDVFGVSADARIEHRRSLPGFSMPHGLDVRGDGLLAVTNYMDNSLRLVDLAARLKQAPPMAAAR
ncbi:MAG TPA: hypothetical protein VF132_14365, partial [Rudaea sp.]